MPADISMTKASAGIQAVRLWRVAAGCLLGDVSPMDLKDWVIVCRSDAAKYCDPVWTRNFSLPFADQKKRLSWERFMSLLYLLRSEINGGGRRIRTYGGDKPSTVFKTAAFDHSASPPNLRTERPKERAL